MEEKRMFRGWQLFAEESAQDGTMTGEETIEQPAEPEETPEALPGNCPEEADTELRERAQRYQALEPVLALLEKKYGVAAGDAKALEQAITREESRASDQARREAQQQEHTRRVQAGAGRILEGWLREGEQLRQLYPDFDLRREMSNPQFSRLLQSRVDMQTAYEIVHKDELIPAAMAYAARTVERKLAQNLQSTAARPRENGSGGGGVVLGSSVAQMSGKQIADLCRRVERGERISLG